MATARPQGGMTTAAPTQPRAKRHRRAPRCAPGATATAGTDPTAELFTMDVTIAGPQASGTRLANLIKPMLDGLVSCFHAHDGSHPDRLRPHLATLGPVEVIWQQLLDQSTALIGVRP